jgi:site-specific DNA-cytosine methylase
LVKLLLGGSPCQHWSVAQKNNREVEPSGMGWELFNNYLIARDKFKPDFFLYENNKSTSQAIKNQIANELGVGIDPDARFTYINSALVSAQNRQRFYVTNFGDIEQPEDRGILLKDILEYGFDLSQRDKSYCLTATYNGACAWNTIERSQRNMVAEPVRVGCYPSPDGTLKNSQGMRLYSIEGKSVNLTANGGGMGAKTGLYAIPIVGESETLNKRIPEIAEKYGYIPAMFNAYNRAEITDKSPTLSTGSMVTSSCATTIFTFAYPIEFDNSVPIKAISGADGKTYPVYEVRNGQITIRDKQYDIKLPDGYYIIRKLTVTECCRLQTMPDDYCKAVSATQAYKALGNGWTAEVIIHLLNHALKDVPRNEEIVVLSLYDGIGTGRYCLDKMGFTNVKYYAYEIDKYPMAIANDNYPDIIHRGDAFQVREEGWVI